MFDFDNSKPITYPNTKFDLEYLIDIHGNIWSPYKKTTLSPQKIKKGYLRQSLRTEGKNKLFMIHRLVLSTFKPIDNLEQLEVNHKDGNKENNELSNLEWCDGSANVRHSLQTGLKVPARGEKVGGNKLSQEDVLEICEKIKSGKYSLQEIGDQYGVSKHAVFDIKRKKSWSWLTENYDFN